MLPLFNGSNIRWSFPDNYICVVKLFAPNYVFSLHMLIIGAGNSHIALYLIGDQAAFVANCLFLPETSQGYWLWPLAGKRYWISRSESTLYWESFKKLSIAAPTEMMYTYTVIQIMFDIIHWTPDKMNVKKRKKNHIQVCPSGTFQLSAS